MSSIKHFRCFPFRRLCCFPLFLFLFFLVTVFSDVLLIGLPLLCCLSPFRPLSLLVMVSSDVLLVVLLLCLGHCLVNILYFALFVLSVLQVVSVVLLLGMPGWPVVDLLVYFAVELFL